MAADVATLVADAYERAKNKCKPDLLYDFDLSAGDDAIFRPLNAALYVTLRAFPVDPATGEKARKGRSVEVAFMPSAHSYLTGKCHDALDALKAADDV